LERQAQGVSEELAMNALQSGMKKALVVTLAIATVGGAMLASTSDAEAQYRYRRGYGAPVAAGIIGGIAAGALIAGAARPAYGYSNSYYAAPRHYGYSQSAYEPVYEEAPACYVQRRKVWIDDFRYTYRRVRVCD
jgi:hypothetical protein